MITSMQLYWLLQLDTFKSATEAAGYIGAIIILGGLFGPIVFNDICSESFVDKCFRIAKIAIIPTLIAFTINIFLPTTKQMATILVLPAIINNEKVQEMGGKTLDIGNDLLDLTKQYFEENISRDGRAD